MYKVTTRIRGGEVTAEFHFRDSAEMFAAFATDIVLENGGNPWDVTLFNTQQVNTDDAGFNAFVDL